MNRFGSMRVLVIALSLSCAPMIVGAQRTISRGHLEQVLGRSSGAIRVVRSTGVSDLGANAASVGIRPGRIRLSENVRYGETRRDDEDTVAPEKPPRG